MPKFFVMKIRNRPKVGAAIVPDLSKRILLTIAAILGALFGLHIITNWLWKTYYIDGAIVLNEGTVGVGIFAFGLLGFLISVVIYKILPNWSEQDTKNAGIGSVGALFASKLCATGACVPAAFISTAFTAPALICVLLGGALGKKFTEKLG